MFQIFKNPDFQFIKYRWICAAASILVIIAGAFTYVARKGFNYGIDFAGGTQITLKFADKPDISRIRELVHQLNLGDVLIQEFDEPGLNELMIRLENTEETGDTSTNVIERLHAVLSSEAGVRDLNMMGKDALVKELASKDLSLEEDITLAADAIANYKKTNGIILAFEDIGSLSDVTPAVFSLLKENTTLGSFALMGTETVGPKVGKDLRSKAQSAILWSLIGMLCYIWLRFRHFAYGLGAIVALFHDVLVTLSFFVFLNMEINLTVVAALLTIVGYSVNDTVVVFDRIRENLRKRRQRDFSHLVNRSVNETLSRTVITSGTTFLTVGSLYALGGDVIRNFSFALVIGVIVGTYSSIFVASPVVISVHEWAQRRKNLKRK